LNNKVKIGAHPSYPDRDNFGRKSMKLPYDDLVNTLCDQIMLVESKTKELGGVLHHIKPHGALYNDAYHDEKIATAIIEGVSRMNSNLCLVAQYGSKLSQLAQKKIKVYYEAFADRNYTDQLTLVPRSEKNAVLSDPKAVFDHVFRMIKDASVKTSSGNIKTLPFDTICVHGDNPRSVEILKYVNQECAKLGIL